ncbi:unnamed protein product [Allacma fusca]|uniref:Uncharacterized protein n=1 Tax=Allacma fusca TaxID=39272 RepID=A0A8J2JH58_9HEXA|nr:unnamed protein product [Allacma fusca]
MAGHSVPDFSGSLEFNFLKFGNKFNCAVPAVDFVTGDRTFCDGNIPLYVYACFLTADVYGLQESSFGAWAAPEEGVGGFLYISEMSNAKGRKTSF